MLTGVVLTRNESKRLPDCLKSLAFCDQLLVIDDQSTDDSPKIARSYNAKVVIHPLNGNFASQRNFALSLIPSGWILFVDADEIVSSALAQEISSIAHNPKHMTHNGFLIPRLDSMWGHTFRHGDAGGVRILRLGQAGIGRWQGAVHETWNIPGEIGTLSYPLLHSPHPTLVEFLQHLNDYSTLRANELYQRGSRSSILQIIFIPPAKFLLLWLVKLGFLDGTPGFIHAMSMAFYSFLVRGKLYLHA